MRAFKPVNCISPRKQRAGRLFTGLVVLAASVSRAVAEEPHPLDRLEPGQWYEVPNSKMKEVSYKWPQSIVIGQCGVDGVMSAWSGGAFDTKRDRLIVWGGGHFAYAGNEIYVFDVKTLKWERVNDPCLNTDPEVKNPKCKEANLYPDGQGEPDPAQPRAMHSYNQIQYVPAIDRFCAMGRAAGFPASGMVSHSYEIYGFDFEKRSWGPLGGKIPIGGAGIFTAVDGSTGHVWTKAQMHGPNVLWEWDPVKGGDAVQRSKPIGNNLLKTAAIDPVRHKLVAVGGGELHCWDLSTPGMIPRSTLQTTGATEIEKSNNPGFEYDPVSEKFVAWTGGADVYVLDLPKLVWTRRSPASSNAVTPQAACRNGTFGRFRYVPSKKVFVLANAVDQNVFFYRLDNRDK